MHKSCTCRPPTATRRPINARFKTPSTDDPYRLRRQVILRRAEGFGLVNSRVAAYRARLTISRGSPAGRRRGAGPNDRWPPANRPSSFAEAGERVIASWAWGVSAGFRFLKNSEYRFHNDNVFVGADDPHLDAAPIGGDDGFAGRVTHFVELNAE